MKSCDVAPAVRLLPGTSSTLMLMPRTSGSRSVSDDALANRIHASYAAGLANSPTWSSGARPSSTANDACTQPLARPWLKRSIGPVGWRLRLVTSRNAMNSSIVASSRSSIVSSAMRGILAPEDGRWTNRALGIVLLLGRHHRSRGAPGAAVLHAGKGSIGVAGATGFRVFFSRRALKATRSVALIARQLVMADRRSVQTFRQAASFVGLG